jgi:hypothetical protein
MIVDAKIYNSPESLGLGYGRVACDSLFWLSAKTEDTCLQRMFTALSFLRILIGRASYATHPFVRRPPSASGRLSLDPSRRSRMLESASNRNVANSVASCSRLVETSSAASWSRLVEESVSESSTNTLH